METVKFYHDKFYTKFCYNYVVWKLCIIKFYTKFCYNYVVWKFCIIKFYICSMETTIGE